MRHEKNARGSLMSDHANGSTKRPVVSPSILVYSRNHLWTTITLRQNSLSIPTRISKEIDWSPGCWSSSLLLLQAKDSLFNRIASNELSHQKRDFSNLLRFIFWAAAPEGTIGDEVLWNTGGICPSVPPQTPQRLAQACQRLAQASQGLTQVSQKLARA